MRVELSPNLFLHHNLAIVIPSVAPVYDFAHDSEQMWWCTFKQSCFYSGGGYMLKNTATYLSVATRQAGSKAIKDMSSISCQTCIIRQHVPYRE